MIVSMDAISLVAISQLCATVVYLACRFVGAMWGRA